MLLLTLAGKGRFAHRAAFCIQLELGDAGFSSGQLRLAMALQRLRFLIKADGCLQRSVAGFQLAHDRLQALQRRFETQ